jgi:hypothetical protein
MRVKPKDSISLPVAYKSSHLTASKQVHYCIETNTDADTETTPSLTQRSLQHQQGGGHERQEQGLLVHLEGCQEES